MAHDCSLRKRKCKFRLGAKIKISLMFFSVRIPWKCVTACPWWASLSHLTCLGMNTFPQWRNLQRGRLASYSGPSDISRPCIFSPSTRPKSSHVSNTALIYASKYYLGTLDAIQRRAVRLIDDSALTDCLDSLAYRRNVSALSFFYRDYPQGRCSDDLKSVIPPSPPKHALRVARVLPIFNTLSQLN